VKLKKLELFGFKSFAERTVFEFEDSLSALVGPNGSGKSNVVDAIKWVLGERSAQKLRGSEMASMIFNGGKGRKPLNYAEVKLVIDNADGWLKVDYEEVCIHRRIDRTGQSNYFINGTPCRLKDIRALLMDTGVGTSAYSFIEQGQIDQLLRASAKERRLVFEEAAGINRFLDQTREAERKLERVSANLARVNDILIEVERQLRSVKYQAARARTFKRQSERLQLLRLAQGLHGYRALLAERRELTRRIEAATAERERLGQAAADIERDLEGARVELSSLQTSLSESRQQLARTEARIESLGREAELNRRRLDELAHQIEQISRRRSALEQGIAALQEEIRQAETELARGTAELEAMTQRFEAGRRRAEQVHQRRREAEQSAEALKARVFDLFQHESRLGNQVEVVAAERRTLSARAERIENRAGKLRDQVAQVDAGRSEARSTLEGLEQKQSTLQTEMSRLTEAIASAEKNLEELAAAEVKARAEMGRKVGRRDTLRDLENRAEGVRTGARKLLEAELPGRIGMVADLVEVPLEVAPAVEAALGDRAQAVVFETAEGARQALALLAGRQAGRADVIALDRVAVPAAAGPIAGCRPLAELVRCDARIAGAVEMLLADTFLVDDVTRLDSLLDAGLPAGARLITAGGESYCADGLWTGGTPETPSLISRRSELAELDEQIARLESRLAELADRRRLHAARRNSLQAEHARLAAELEQVARSAGQMRSRLEAADRRASELEDELNLARAEALAVSREMQELDGRSARLAEELEKARAERAEAQSASEAEAARLRTLQEQEQAVGREVGELSSELARTREHHNHLKALLERLTTEKGRREAEFAGMQDEREANARRRREAEAAIQAAGEEAAELTSRRQALRAAINAQTEELEQHRRRIAQMTERSHAVSAQRQQSEERLQALRMQEMEASTRMENLLDRIAEDYGVRLQALELEPERWREESPFLTRSIREFTDAPALEEAPKEKVASWYRQMTAPAEEQPQPAEEELEMIALEEARELRRSVMELAGDPATDWEAVRREIATLKAKVDRIGNVNVDSIRQQEELETRLQFLTDQKEDLEKARRHERDIIRELNKKSRERFRQTFEQVRRNFQGLFRKLFGGGSADLILEEDAEDILEAGIEMVARPPGKESATITLLSGGEKALTAVALLFAMFQAKPSPFCLLDEVDAPLDDANVERFLRLLEEFQRDTQFIIITHNKVTMNVAAVLYGLTMADGVSKKISVRFEDVSRRAATEPLAKAG